MTTLGTPSRPSRYSPAMVSDEITHQRIRLGWEVKDLAMEAGMGDTMEHARDNWYKAVKRHSWTIEQMGCLAAVLEAPPYWPLQHWTVELQRTYPGRRGEPSSQGPRHR